MCKQFISGIGFTNIFNRKYKTNFTTKEIVDLELNGTNVKKNLTYMRIGLRGSLLS